MSRRLFITGNWKMNKGPQEADALARDLKAQLADEGSVDLAVCPPAVSIPAVVSRLRHTGIEVGGQNLHPEPSGAFTGEVSGPMLRQAGCTYVIVGHSERRALFSETDELVAQKLKAAFAAGLLPILCVGETLEERDAGQADAVVKRQLAVALAELPADQVVSTTIAYEPVWAIGTGRNASPEQAQEMHAAIRGWLGQRFAEHVPRQMRIQYGGSVKPGNAAALLSQPDIDGALIGGASLDTASFVAIVRAGSKAKG